jgi:hypothetical protein
MKTRLVVPLVVAVVGPGTLIGPASSGPRSPSASWDPAHGILIEGATVVTMDDHHTVIPHGRVLVRDGRITAVWSGRRPPDGVTIGDARDRRRP